jgi:DNA polymerase III subunit beta
VTPSAGQDDLGGVLIELDADEVSLVATDRYRLAIRRLRPASFAGTARPVVVPASDLAGLRSWIATGDEVRVSASDGVATVACGDEIRELTAADGFPDYRAILDGLPSEVTRVLVDRSGLADRLNGNGGPVIVEAERDRVVVDGTGLDAICSGPAVSTGSRRRCWRPPWPTASGRTCCWRSGRRVVRSWCGPRTRARLPRC